MKNEVLDTRKLERRNDHIDDLPETRFVQPPEQEDLTELHEERALVRKTLKKLPAEDQELYRLSYVEEL